MSEATDKALAVLKESDQALEMYRLQGVTAAVDRALTIAINHMSAYGEEFGDRLYDENPKLHARYNSTVDALVQARKGTYVARLKDPLYEGTKAGIEEAARRTASFGDRILGTLGLSPDPKKNTRFFWIVGGVLAAVGVAVYFARQRKG